MPICPGGQHTVFARHRRSAGLHGGLTVFSLLLPLIFWLSALASEMPHGILTKPFSQM
jgi:hypothetical protein